VTTPLQGYYQNSSLYSHRKMLEKIVDLNCSNNKTAIDLGCGAGNDTAYLLEQGYNVTAIDNSSDAIEICLQRFKDSQNISILQKNFENCNFIKSTLLIAFSSLFFCQSSLFKETWQRIVDSIEINGIFCGDFLGVDDSWARSESINVVTKNELTSLFQSFEILFIKERNEAGQCALGKPKHWHSYTVAARRRSSNL